MVRDHTNNQTFEAEHAHLPILPILLSCAVNEEDVAFAKFGFTTSWLASYRTIDAAADANILVSGECLVEAVLDFELRSSTSLDILGDQSDVLTRVIVIILREWLVVYHNLYREAWVRGKDRHNGTFAEWCCRRTLKQQKSVIDLHPNARQGEARLERSQ
jgi:hypothetical protein